MRVLKEGNFSHIFPLQVKCERLVDEYGYAYGDAKDFCGSELEVDMTDIKRHEWTKYPDYKGTDFGVVCPVCGQFITINRNKIPKMVLNNAKKVTLS